MRTSKKAIYECYINGGILSNNDIIDGYGFYLQLAKDLKKCGDVFKLAANEAMRIADGLEGYARARSLLNDNID